MIKCIVDSSCDLTPALASKLGILVLPTPVQIDETAYLDGKDLSPKQLTDLLGSSGHTVRTRHVTPAAYEEAFLPFAAAGDTVLCLCCAKSIAGDYASAKTAAVSVHETHPDFTVHVLDTKSASAGYGLIAVRLAEMIQKGCDLQTLLQAADFYIAHIRHYFSVSMMTYFMKSGRIGHALGAVGETLDVRPLFTLDTDGDVQSLQTIPIKGSDHVADTILDLMKGSGVDFSVQTLAFCHGGDKNNLDYFVEKAKEELHPREVTIRAIGCATAAHTGNSMTGVAYFDAADPYTAK